MLIGQNIIRFDLPVLQKLRGFKWTGAVFDTLAAARITWPDIKNQFDYPAFHKGAFPGRLIGAHGLEAYGYRLGVMKDEYEGDPEIADKKERKRRKWESWNPTMQAYCDQDVRVTFALLRKIIERWPGDEPMTLEHDVIKIIARQERRGVCFDFEAAGQLHATLVDHQARLQAQLRELFPAWEEVTTFTPKRNDKVRGYVKGQTIERRKLVEFQASNRHHIAKVLTDKYQWEPDEFNDDGTPKLDEEVMALLPYPEAPLLSEALMVQKRLGAVATGSKAYLKLARYDNLLGEWFLYGSVNSCGAATLRMTHSDPNMTQVPSNDVPYGHDCRALMKARKGYKLVGCDADALELRGLAGYLFKSDKGKYRDTVLGGRKEDGTDMHTLNAIALGMDPKGTYKVGALELSGRDIAKTWFYAWIYGAGFEKLGHIKGVSGPKAKGFRGKLVDQAAASQGKRDKEAFLNSLPALKGFVEAAQFAAKTRKSIVTMHGLTIPCRSVSGAPNTVLQSFGAVVMKRALVILDMRLQLEAGFRAGEDYEFVLNVHDEWQIEARPEIANTVGAVAAEAIAQAGEYYRFPCPLKGNYQVGDTWADTH